MYQADSDPYCYPGSDVLKNKAAAGAAHFLAELNAIHPFREGNGRAQLTFLALLGEQAGHSVDLNKLDPAALLNAMISSFNGHETFLARAVRGLLAP